jgi:hypothetical protein
VRGGGGDDIQPLRRGQCHERVVTLGVVRKPVGGELDDDMSRAEQLGQPAKLSGRGGRPLAFQRCPHCGLAATGEHHPVPTRGGGYRVEVIHRLTLLFPGDLGVADHPGQPAVTLGVAGQHEQVLALRVGYPVLR